MTKNSTAAANVIPFDFGKKPVRAMLIDDQPWFVADDVADALQYSEASAMTRHLDDDEKGLSIVQTLGGDQKMLVINESGLYSAILRSRKAEAKRFKKWVTAEVLPAIRKTGGYSASPSIDTEEGKLLMIQELAAKQLALIHENKQIAAERDHAIATKAHIGSKREAAAMAKASSAVREVNRLKEELGRNRKHATIISVERAVGEKLPKNTYVALRRWCKANEVEPVEVVDERYGSVKAWPAGAWLEAHGIDLRTLFSDKEAAA